MRVTDRSRIESFFACQRKRYWAYELPDPDGVHVGGVLPEGIVPVDLAYGLAFHEGAEVIQGGGSWQDAFAHGKRQLEPLRDGRTLDGESHEDEYGALLYGHLRSLGEYFWPRFVADYEVISAETEMILPLSDDLLGMFRLDLAARHRESGLVYNVEWKTDSSPSDIGLRMQYYLQLLLEAKALAEHIGEYVAGTVIIGIDKGTKSKATAKDKEAGRYGDRRLSPFTYAYVKDTGFNLMYRHKWASSWDRIPTWGMGRGFGLGADVWWDKLIEQGFDPLSQFVQTPPVLYDEDRYQSVRRQLVAMEAHIGKVVHDNPLSVDSVFWQNFQNCKNDGGYKRECPFTDLCFGAAAYDPTTSGYKWREPNHPLETTIRLGGK